MRLRRWMAAFTIVGVAACDAPGPSELDVYETDPAIAADVDDDDDEDGAEGEAEGGGLLDFGGGLMVAFDFEAESDDDGGDLAAEGDLFFSVVLGGQLIEFFGDVTCLAVDGAEGRAWIGGVITVNNSEHPSWMTEIHEPGKDIWFRVLDNGEDASEPDRSTFVGFEGGGGIITSQEYCEAQIWPDGNARTVPQSSGDIEVEIDD